jgi:hypothetical protein
VGAALHGRLVRMCFVDIVDERGERHVREDLDWSSEFCRAQQ